MRSPASVFQKNVARKLAIQIDLSSFAVAAAQIETALAPALFSEGIEIKTASDRQIEYASALGIDVSQEKMKIASVRIQERLDELNAEMIKSMKLSPGKRVWWKAWDREMVISSISKNGRLWFKGGNGYGAFPHEVEVKRKSRRV